MAETQPGLQGYPEDDQEMYRNIEQQFHRAVDIVQALPKAGPIQSSYDDKLSMYALYKQATEGNVLIPRPGLFDLLGRAKWDAWAKQKDLERGEAMERYVEVLLKVLEKHEDQPESGVYIKELEAFVGVPEVQVGEVRRRPRANSSSSSSSQSISSFHEASAVSPSLSHSHPTPIAPSGPSHFLPYPHPPPRQPLQTPSLGLPITTSDLPPRTRKALPRRASDSDSSISVGGDAMSHKGRASKAGSVVDTRTGGAVSALASVFEPGGKGKGRGGFPVQQMGPPAGLGYGQNPVGPGISQLRASELPARRPSPGLLPPPNVHPNYWNSPGAASRVSEEPPRIPARMPHHTPIGTPQYDYRDRLSPALSILPPPASSRRPLSYPTEGMPHPMSGQNIDLNLALQQIQISLTALHERISSLEHSQTLILTQPSDPFTTLLRSIFPSSLSHPSVSRNGAAARRRSLSVRLLWRLIGTVRRAIVDVAFVLVMISLGMGVWAGVKGRGRGGRRAVMLFWGRLAGFVREWRGRLWMGRGT